MWQKRFYLNRSVTQDTYICSLHFANKIGPENDDDEPINATLTEQEVRRKQQKGKRKLPIDRSVQSTKCKKDDTPTIDSPCDTLELETKEIEPAPSAVPVKAEKQFFSI